MKRRAKRGFMLVELLMVATVLGVGLFAVFQAMSSAWRTHRAAGDSFEASLALGEKTWAWRRAGVLPPRGSDETDEDRRWDWTVEKRDALGETLSLSLSWTAGGRRRALEVYDHRS